MGWSPVNGSTTPVYADKETYLFDADVYLWAIWRRPGLPINIVARLTGPTSASVTFEALPNVDGTPAAIESYVVQPLRAGVGEAKRTVSGPGTYDFAVVPGSSYKFSLGDSYSNQIEVPLPANLKSVRFLSPGGIHVSGTMATQYASTPTALTANAFRQTDLVFVGWSSKNDDVVNYADNATYAFDTDGRLVAVWRKPGDPVNIAAALTGPTSASVTFKSAPNVDGTPKVMAYYDVVLVRDGYAGIETRRVSGPDNYSFNVEPGHSYVFQVGGYRSNDISVPLAVSVTPSASASVRTVTFDPNGGSGSMASQPASKATALTPIADAIKRAGYAFNGWNTSANGNGTAFADGASYLFATNATLYATWGCLPLTVTASAKRVGAARAEVKFTASQSDSPWTSFAANAAKEGGKGGTVNTSSTTGTIPVTGLDKNSGYTFDVTATNEAGCTYKATANRVLKW